MDIGTCVRGWPRVLPGVHSGPRYEGRVVTTRQGTRPEAQRPLSGAGGSMPAACPSSLERGKHQEPNGPVVEGGMRARKEGGREGAWP